MRDTQGRGLCASISPLFSQPRSDPFRRVHRCPSLLLAIVVAQWSAAQLGRAGVVYVNGVLTNLASLDGKTWNTAYAKVQQGLDASVAGDEVWVAKGTYFERIKIRLGVALFGGFAGTESERAERRWIANLTVLDGSSKGTVVTMPTGATDTTRIDGFVVQHGSGRNGGGISCVSSSPVIANSTITLNKCATFGHGIYCERSEAVITNNLLQMSANLVQWETVATNTGPNFEWTQPDPACAPERFFRAIGRP